MSPTELAAMQQIATHGPINRATEVVGVADGRVSLGLLARQGLIEYRMVDGGRVGWVLTAHGKKVLSDEVDWSYM